MLFDIIILIGIIAVIVGRHNSKGTTHELPNYTIVYVIGIPFLAIAVFSSFLTQYTPDFIKNVFACGGGYNVKFWHKFENIACTKNLSQQDIADRLSINRTTYTKWELGVSEPSLTMLLKLAEIYDVDCNRLLEKTECESSTL